MFMRVVKTPNMRYNTISLFSLNIFKLKILTKIFKKFVYCIVLNFEVIKLLTLSIEL